jgi:hypothetical protein
MIARRRVSKGRRKSTALVSKHPGAIWFLELLNKFHDCRIFVNIRRRRPRLLCNLRPAPPYTVESRKLIPLSGCYMKRNRQSPWTECLRTKDNRVKTPETTRCTNVAPYLDLLATGRISPIEPRSRPSFGSAVTARPLQFCKSWYSDTTICSRLSY